METGLQRCYTEIEGANHQNQMLKQHIVYLTQQLRLSNQENQATDKPLSFYAATKKSNESMAYTYSHLYKIPIIGNNFGFLVWFGGGSRRVVFWG